MNYLVVGYYGYANAGDETLLRRTIELISDSDPTAQIYVLHPKHPKCPPPEQTVPVNRFNIFKLIGAMRKVDTVVFGGGGIFQDQSSLKSLGYYTGVVWVASRFRKRVVLIGQGFSKPKRKVSLDWVRFVLKRADWIGCRDAESFQLVTQLYRHANAFQTGDLALLSSPHLSPPSGNQIAVSLRDTPFKEYLSKLLDNWFPIETSEVVGISFEGQADTDILEENGIRNTIEMGNGFPDTPFDSQPILVIAMRYHACVWAALNGIPFIALVYDDKVASLATVLKQPCIDLRNSIHNLNLINAVKTVKQNRATFIQLIRENIGPLIAAAQRNRLPFNGE